jgi:AcrR family transcriptional regulator
MGTAERRERERRQNRRKFLDAARQILTSEGYEALTMRRVAEQSEYSVACLYLHFPDKMAMVRELCTHDLADFMEWLEGVSLIADPVERLTELASRYVDFANHHPEQYRLLFLTPALTLAGPLPGDPEREAYAVLETSVCYALSCGLFSSLRDNSTLVAQTLWAGIHGVLALGLARSEPCVIELQPQGLRMDAMCAAIIAGLERTSLRPRTYPPPPMLKEELEEHGPRSIRRLGTGSKG